MTSAISSRKTVREVDAPIVPLGFLAVGGRPLEWLGAWVEARAIFAGGNSWVDVAGFLRSWPLGGRVFLDAGLRWQNAALSDLGDAEVDATLFGLRTSVGVEFE